VDCYHIIQLKQIINLVYKCQVGKTTTEYAVKHWVLATEPWLLNFENNLTSSSAMAERPRELGDFKELSQFEAKF